MVLKPVRDEGSRVRVYLCGRPTVECRQRAISEASLGGGQGRLLLAFLGTRRTRPVSRPEVIEALWGSRRPPSVETTLNAVVSKLRSALRRVGVAPPHGVATDLGSYQFVMPDAWIDLEAAKTALDAAEGSLRRGDWTNAWAAANVATAIASQPFLADEDAPWVVRERARLQRVWRRGSIALSTISTMKGEFELGIQHAADALAAEPFDEVACAALMRAHAAAGNRAEALRVYARCRELFRDELGADPSAQTTQVFLSILKGAT